MIWELKKLLYESIQFDHLGYQQFQGTLKVACLRNRVQHVVQFRNRSGMVDKIFDLSFFNKF